MKKLFLFLCVLGFAVIVPASAQSLPQVPEVGARAYLLLDLTADQVLASREEEAGMPPASLTKLMTAYLVFDALRVGKLELDEALPVSELAWRQLGSRMFLEPRMKVPVEDLLKGLLVQSGNDAAVVLAEGVAGSVERFVRLMNEQAQALGMAATSFRNPTGLPEPGHVSTARDLGILATRLLRDFPDQSHFHATRKYRYAGTPPANDSNRNLLLFRDPSVDGLKTGHAEAAGYSMIASARRDFPNLGPDGTPGARRLLAIVLGAASDSDRANESQKLLNWGYTAFEAVKLFDAGQPVASPSVWKGKSNTVKLGRPQAIVLAIPAGSSARLQTQVARPDPLVAPFVKGQAVGTLKVTTGAGQPVADIPLVALEAVEEAGIVGRAWDSIRLWIK